MRKAFLFILLFIVVVNIKAQDYLQDNLLLKNGENIRGLVIKQDYNESLSIVNSEGDTLYFRYDEIEKLTREPISDKAEKSFISKSFYPKYQLTVEGSASFGVNMSSTNHIKINIINGVRLNRLFSLGFGLGLRYNLKTELVNLEPDYPHFMFPVFTDFRTYFSINKNISTFLGLGFGCSFEPDQVLVWDPEIFREVKKTDYSRMKNRGALFIPSAGISFRLSEITQIHIGISYELQYGEFTYYYMEGNHYSFYNVGKFAGSVSINGGITF
jgi:hypothetical protein